MVVILPQSWLIAKYCDESFKWHVNIIKVQHYYLKMTRPSKVCMSHVLFGLNLDL